jgi:hypothetical protein
MKRNSAAATIIAVFAALCSAGVPAQTQTAAPAATAAGAAAPAPAPAPAKATPRAKSRSWTRADARVCLEFPTNLQVIKCSEKYRYTRVPA